MLYFILLVCILISTYSITVKNNAAKLESIYIPIPFPDRNVRLSPIEYNKLIDNVKEYERNYPSKYRDILNIINLFTNDQIPSAHYRNISIDNIFNRYILNCNNPPAAVKSILVEIKRYYLNQINSDPVVVINEIMKTFMSIEHLFHL